MVGKSINAWLRIIRLPNLFTVPGDCIAGAVLLGGSVHLKFEMLQLVFASICIYTAGLITNDWFDRDIDRIERPKRPIPSGVIKSSYALYVAIVLFMLSCIAVFSLGLYSLFMVASLIILVILYNSSFKKIVPIGFITLGACRGLNIILGASSGLHYLSAGVIIAALTEALYIIMVSAIAFNETSRLPSNIIRVAPFVVLFTGLTVFYSYQSVSWYVYVLAVLILIRVGSIVWSIKPGLAIGALPGKIGILIRMCILIQSLFIFSGKTGASLGLIILLFWLLSEQLGKKFAGS